MFLGILGARIDPLDVRAAAERSHEVRPLTFAAHALGEPLVEGGAKRRIIEGFDVGLRVLLVICFMGDDDDAAVHRTLESALDHGGIHGLHGQSVHATGDQVLDDLELLVAASAVAVCFPR